MKYKKIESPDEIKYEFKHGTITFGIAFSVDEESFLFDAVEVSDNIENKFLEVYLYYFSATNNLEYDFTQILKTSSFTYLNELTDVYADIIRKEIRNIMPQYVAFHNYVIDKIKEKLISMIVTKLSNIGLTYIKTATDENVNYYIFEYLKEAK